MGKSTNRRKKAREQEQEDDELFSAVAVSAQLPRAFNPADDSGVDMPGLTSAGGPLALPLLICSIGNPGPQYKYTLHSAGHTMLEMLRDLAQHSGCRYTDWARERDMGGGLASFPIVGQRLGWSGMRPGKATRGEGAQYTGDESAQQLWTWWQSGRFMNESGEGVAAAAKRWRWGLRESKVPAELLARARVVVLHDELEAAVGKFVVRREKSSARGHNGLKSVGKALAGAEFVRIGLGIGRPESRDPEVVSRHVLRRMTKAEYDTMFDMAPEVLEALRDVGEGK